MVPKPPWEPGAFPEALPLLAALAIYIFVGLYVLHYIVRAAKAVRQASFAAYVYWVLKRDVRVWITIAFIGLQTMLAYNEDAPSWAIAIVSLPLIAFTKGLSPPQVLLLHSFDERNYSFGRSLSTLVPICNVISLFPGRLKLLGLPAQLEDMMHGINER